MKKIWLLVLLPFLIACCDTIRTTEDSGIIAEDLLGEFVQTEDASLLQYYADEIAECEKLNTAWSVYAAKFDLNQDGSKETISYLISTLNSGSSGNVILHMHSQNKAFPFSSAIYLNPHPDGENLIPKLQVMESQSGGYHNIKYAAFDDSGAVVMEQYFHFDGIGYIS